MTLNKSKKIIVGTIIMVFAITSISAYAWGNRKNQGKGMGQGVHASSNAMYGQQAKQSVNGNAGDLRGRDYARLGQSKEVNGTLKLEGTEWFLSVEEKTYALHMGPEDYRESVGFSLSENAEAKVAGFVYNADIAVKSISSEGKSIVLRDDTGRPAWAGTRFSNRQASN